MQFIWKGVFLNPSNKDLPLSKMIFYSPLNAAEGTSVTGQN